MNYRIALVHGFFRNYKDMEELENNLMGMGYTVDNLNLKDLIRKMKLF